MDRAPLVLLGHQADSIGSNIAAKYAFRADFNNAVCAHLSPQYVMVLVHERRIYN
jgi:hypothetical protein